MESNRAEYGPAVILRVLSEFGALPAEYVQPVIGSSTVLDIASEKKRKLKGWHRPRLLEVHYPDKILKTKDRHRWIEAMMLDRRLTERARLVLCRLALHLNLQTGRCDPSVSLLAMEVSFGGSEDVAQRMARRSLSSAEKLGWIKRLLRRGGGTRLSQTNSYVLTIPAEIEAILKRNPTHTEDSDRTPVRVRSDSRVRPTGPDSPPNTEGGIGNMEHSDPQGRRPSLTRSGAALGYDALDSYEKSKNAVAQVSSKDVGFIQDLVSSEGMLTVQAVIARCRQHGVDQWNIDGRQIGAMVKAGYLTRIGDYLAVTAENSRRAENLHTLG
jgi:hypothetical protein